MKITVQKIIVGTPNFQHLNSILILPRIEKAPLVGYCQQSVKPKKKKYIKYYMLKRVSSYLQNDLWRIRTRKLPRSKSIQINNLRVIIVASKGFIRDNCQLRASALTFYTMLSIVPIAAMLFGIAKGFGMEKALADRLMDEFSQHQQALTYIMNFANSLLENTKTGTMAGIGVIILFYTIVMVLGNIEESFNDIWGIKKQRSIGRKLSDYLSFILICPFLLIVSGSTTVVVTSFLNDICGKFTSGVYLMILFFTAVKLFAYFIPWLLFTFVYLFMPNTKVKISSGIIAGIIAGSAYQIIQWIYIKFQIGVASYNAIYGTFAAMPLFLVWLQLSWLTVLFGAELCFAHENVESYELEPDYQKISPSLKKLVTLRIAALICRNFHEEKPTCSDMQISHILDIPIRSVRDSLSQLEQAGIICEAIGEDNNKEAGYIPAIPVEHITIAKVLDGLDDVGENNIDHLKSAEFAKISCSLEKFRDEIHNSKSNMLLQEI